ncbi:hypothetical protein [Caenimonas aquaedulcis]|uniref:Uncharacterized protein n=1 Tax=Caenimonas aquaedulcis TaxID=2793270 RepID=A0A931MHM0_9BURK|nr:hypothetical protein [Caenimonas aquaedulcis]MBG9389221.1 hypothetical protein [Caenimonas aquaedulcis]
MALASACTMPAAFAAGGHHAVDDATLMEPGNCEAEGWFTRSQGPSHVLHAGLACRAGPVELAAAAESARDAGSSHPGWAAQLKWAAPVTREFAWGVSVTPIWQGHERPRYQATTIAALATWNVNDSLLLHANLGRDIRPNAAGRARSGVALEWSPRPRLSVVGERYIEEQAHYLRAGLRWSASDRLTLDVSHARRLAGPGASNWTIGATHRFDTR